VLAADNAPALMTPIIVTFPRDDTAFAAYVRSTLDRLPAAERRDPAAVQAALRRWHTRALVRPQDPLASLGGTSWYVYRDGSAGVRSDQEWWKSDTVATARLGEDEVFVDGDEAACDLVDRPPGGLAGVPWRELVPSEARDTDGEWLFGPLKDGRPVQSVFDFPRADGSRRVVEYRTVWLPDERIYLCRWRELAVIVPEPPSQAADRVGS
jgi:PAS domain-containing protein